MFFCSPCHHSLCSYCLQANHRKFKPEAGLYYFVSDSEKQSL
ncbi:hypothetical protein [Botryobacter ruber]